VLGASRGEVKSKIILDSKFWAKYFEFYDDLNLFDTILKGGKIKIYGVFNCSN